MFVAEYFTLEGDSAEEHDGAHSGGSEFVS